MNATFRARFPCSFRSVGDARRRLVSFVQRYGFAPQVVADIECAIGEALANAAEHGYRDGTTFDVHARIDGGNLVIDVQDDGPGFPHAAVLAVEEPPAGSPRGFGIFIMRSMMDEIAYSDRGRRLTLKKRLPGSGGGAAGQQSAFA
jgi:anti-sigma regulatory factor (Ser/Thr protein kinase)